MISINKIKKLLTYSKYNEKLIRGHEIESGWLLPCGYSITANVYDHSDIIDVLNLTDDNVYEYGWVRKALAYEYQFTKSKRKAFKVVENDIKFNIKNKTNDTIIFIDTWQNGLHSYQFTIKDFKDSGMNLRKMLTSKYDLSDEPMYKRVPEGYEQ